MNTQELTCKLALPENFRSADILPFHARDHLAIAERVDGNSLHKGILWQGLPACLSIRFNENTADVALAVDNAQPFATGTNNKLTTLATRMLGLNQTIAEFEQRFRHHPLIGPLIQQRPGLRVPASASVFEALTWAITGQQISVNAAVSIRRKLIQAAGIQHASGFYCYPDPHCIADMPLSDLRQAGFSQNKAQTILTISQQILSGELVLDYGNPNLSVEHLGQQLLAIRGIGRWTVNYTLLRGYGWLDSSLHGDVAVRRGLQLLLGSAEKVDELQTRLWLEPFAPWRALVAAHLWAYIQTNA